MTDDITRNEVFNDGKTIHLYFNDMIGLYVAYGISAFQLCKYAHINPSYSEEMQMPVVVIDSEHFEKLNGQIGLSKNVGNYRCLAVDKEADMDEYSEWASQLRGCEV